MPARLIAAVAAALVLLLAQLPARAQDFDPAQVDAGMRLYKPTAGNCELCHGWTGTGRQHDTMYSPVVAGGPSLVASKMSRDQMIEIVSCGTLHWWGVMPKYRNDTWTVELPCYGKVTADMPDDERPVIGDMQMTRQQIEAVVTYVQAVLQGKGMDLANCMKYWGDKSAACNLLR